jgi:hypothetical protein
MHRAPGQFQLNPFVEARTFFRLCVIETNAAAVLSGTQTDELTGNEHVTFSGTRELARCRKLLKFNDIRVTPCCCCGYGKA